MMACYLAFLWSLFRRNYTLALSCLRVGVIPLIVGGAVGTYVLLGCLVDSCPSQLSPDCVSARLVLAGITVFWRLIIGVIHNVLVLIMHRLRLDAARLTEAETLLKAQKSQ